MRSIGSVIATADIVYGAGSIEQLSVRPSVPLSVPSFDCRGDTVGLLLSTVWAGDVTPVTNVVGRSATQQLMVVPRHRLTTVGRRAFAVHGPMVWNSLPDDLRAQQDYESFRQGLQTWLFSRY